LLSASIDWIPRLVCSNSGLSTLLRSLPAGNIENIRNIKNKQHMFRQYIRLTNNTITITTTATTTPAPLALAL